MFQYISVFLSHYPPKRPPFPRDSDNRISDKQVRALAQCSCLSSSVCGLHALSGTLCVIIWLPVIYLCITHTVQVPLAGRLSSIGPHHPDIWSCYIAISQHSCRANTLAYCTVSHLVCHSVCVKGQVCVLTSVFPGHLSYFKAFYTAVLLLIPLLLQCFRVFCHPIAIH